MENYSAHGRFATPTRPRNLGGSTAISCLNLNFPIGRSRSLRNRAWLNLLGRLLVPGCNERGDHMLMGIKGESR